MERFQPDSWLEGLLRPFLMMDPAGWIYVEAMAPDWRFGLFALFLALGLALSLGARRLDTRQGQLALGVFGSMLLWTFVIGNGRYFMAGLLLIGPLLVAAWRLLPGTAAARATALAGALALQAGVVASTFEPDHWSVVQWKQGAGIDIEPSPLQQQPAVFITASTISYSILVPRFHPQARWANVVGQYDIIPGTREYAAMVRLLAGPLTKYLVWPIQQQPGDATLQPTGQLREVIEAGVRPLGVTLAAAPCQVLRSRLAPGNAQGPRTKPSAGPTVRGFWFCPIDYSDALRSTATAQASWPAPVLQAFGAIERRCPKFFPPGNGKERHGSEFAAMRLYPTDMRLLVDDEQQVLMRYHRALNFTILGTLDQVGRGDFALQCDKLPGRYVPPWARP
jgi:hypothetical protein